MIAKEAVKRAFAKRERNSAALRQIEGMLVNPRTQWSQAPGTQSADELRSIWSIRLWNAVLQGKRITGLRDFVRRVHELAPESRVAQIALRSGGKTALIFLQKDALIGAVVTSPTEVDRQNGLARLAIANGEAAPYFLTGSAKS